MIFIILASIVGLFTYYSKHFTGYVRPVVLKLIHNVSGQVAFIVGIVSLCLGFYIPWFVYYTTEQSRATVTAITAILCAWTLVYALISTVKQARSIVNK